MRQFLKDALDCEELEYQLDCISTDDNCKIEEYSDSTILGEAHYLLEKYSQPGYLFHGRLLAGLDGLDAQLQAQKEVEQLENFIAKWGNKLDGLYVKDD
jgi:hypothetical protein